MKCSGNARQVCGGNSASKFYSMYTGKLDTSAATVHIRYMYLCNYSSIDMTDVLHIPVEIVLLLTSESCGVHVGLAAGFWHI